MKITTIVIFAALTIAGCSSSDNPAPVNDAPVTQFADTAMVQYDNLVPSGIVPTLADVFITTQDMHWFCSIDTGAEIFTQLAATFSEDGTGEILFNNVPGTPNEYPFTWSGEQELSISSEFDSITFFNFNYRTDPAEIAGNPIYEFLSSQTSGSGLVLCSKIDAAF